MGIVARAQCSPAATAAQKEIAQVGEYVCDSSTAQAFERGIIQYAQAVMELDVRFLEQVREEICTGMDGFELIMAMKGAVAGKQVYIAPMHSSLTYLTPPLTQRLFKLAAFLVSILERIAERLDTYYVELSAQSLYHPEMEDNPARARWRLVRRRIRDSSFFLYTQDITLDTIRSNRFDPASLPDTGRSRLSISFDRVISQANEMVQQSLHRHEASEDRDNLSSLQRPPRRLADAHSRRAEDSGLSGVSSYEKHLDRRAAHRVSTFLTGNMKAIRRLSQAVDVTALEHALGSSNTPRERSRSRTPLGSRIPTQPAPLRPESRGRQRSEHRSEREFAILNSTRMKGLERSGSVSSSSSSSSSSRGERQTFLPGSPRDSLRTPMQKGRRAGAGTRNEGEVVARALEGLRVRT